jgi:hypothetical protein
LANGGGHVVIVEVCLIGLDQRDAMARMWLDQRNVVPSAFRQFAFAEGMALQVEFTATGDAEAFAEEFGGQVV